MRVRHRGIRSIVRHAKGSGTHPSITAPADCTSARALETLVRSVHSALRRGEQVLELDLSAVQRMNSMLLSAVIYLARECWRCGAALQLTGVNDEFRAWATTHGVLRHLHGRGLIAEPVASEPVPGPAASR